jgi:hypothetical protein
VIEMTDNKSSKYLTTKKFNKFPEYEKQQLITIFNSILGNMVLSGNGEQEIVEHLVDIFGLSDSVHIDRLD